MKTHCLPLVSDTMEQQLCCWSQQLFLFYLETLISCNALRAHPVSHHRSALFMSSNPSAAEACQRLHPWAQLQLPREKCLPPFSSKCKTAGWLGIKPECRWTEFGLKKQVLLLWYVSGFLWSNSFFIMLSAAKSRNDHSGKNLPQAAVWIIWELQNLRLSGHMNQLNI